MPEPIPPFDFLWCYEPEDDDDEEHCGCLLLGTPETVTPLHIDLTNIIPGKTISISSINGATEANANTYHFKLAFQAGILVETEKIAVETENWSLSTEENNLYLLWTGDPFSLNQQQATEIILTGVAAESAVKITTTNVTISWEFDQGIAASDIALIPPPPSDYTENITLELEMIKTSGKSNIPLFVGFVGSNKVMNVHDESNTLKLRITNTNLPNVADPNITFHYDNDPDQCSQLVIVLEVGNVTDVPWALGTEDDVNAIGIELNEQWQQKEEIKEIKDKEDVVKALQWTFIPSSADVVLEPQETLLIDLTNIVTTHPTGEANLYLKYQYIEGYKDGQFICQIEKAPLVFDDKVRMGTKKNENLDGLLTVKDGISLDYPGEIQHTGSFIFRSDVDNGGDGSSVKFLKQDSNTPLMELQANGSLILGQRRITPTNQYLGLYQNVNATKSYSWIQLWGEDLDNSIERTGELCLSGTSIAFRSNSTDGYVGDQRMILNQQGQLGIGTTTPSAQLDVQGDTVITGKMQVNGKSKSSELEITDKAIFNGNVGIGTASPSAKLDVNGKLKTKDFDLNGLLTFHGNPFIKLLKKVEEGEIIDKGYPNTPLVQVSVEMETEYKISERIFISAMMIVTVDDNIQYIRTVTHYDSQDTPFGIGHYTGSTWSFEESAYFSLSTYEGDVVRGELYVVLMSVKAFEHDI